MEIIDRSGKSFRQIFPVRCVHLIFFQSSILELPVVDKIYSMANFRSVVKNLLLVENLFKLGLKVTFGEMILRQNFQRPTLTPSPHIEICTRRIRYSVSLHGMDENRSNFYEL